MSSFLSRRPARSLLALPVALTAIALSLGGCDEVKPAQDSAEERTLYDFSSAMRWGDFDAAYDFVDPKAKIEHPLSDIDRGRLKQVEVSGYEVTAKVKHEGVIDQEVKLGLVNRNTQVPRSIIYHEHWTWDAEHKKWWLTSGLPDISPQD